ncbi:VPA1331 family putative T3SS effector, partial [Vibrio parahaemolyticus]|nr:VPA1331 family putative T3SS effector [Vibrio parahaemolyticus]
MLSDDQASLIITRKLRKNISQKASARMFSEGDYWKRK